MYLKKYNVTCKDLRTWNANIIFLKNVKHELELWNKDQTSELKIRKKIIRESLKKTASSLHHTPAICKSSYIYKDILNKIEDNDIIINKLVNENIKVEKLLFELLKKNRNI